MPASVLSFPFRLDLSGVAATVEHGSDGEVDELLAVAMLTAPGERIQVPTFGVDDPAFAGFELGNLQRHVIDFGPDVTIASMEIARRGDGREEVSLTWTRTGGGQ